MFICYLMLKTIDDSCGIDCDYSPGRDQNMRKSVGIATDDDYAATKGFLPIFKTGCRPMDLNMGHI